jgi:hypothetical protein
MIVPALVFIGKAIGVGLDVAIAVDRTIDRVKPAWRKLRDRVLPPDPSYPLSHRDVEHIQDQIRKATRGKT